MISLSKICAGRVSFTGVQVKLFVHHGNGPCRVSPWGTSFWYFVISCGLTDVLMGSSRQTRSDFFIYVIGGMAVKGSQQVMTFCKGSSVDVPQIYLGWYCAASVVLLGSWMNCDRRYTIISDGIHKNCIWLSQLRSSNYSRKMNL